MSTGTEGTHKDVKLPHLPKELVQLEQMQTLFSDLNQYNVQEATKTILDSPFSRSRDLAPKLAAALLKIIPLRPGETNNFVELCKILRKSESSGNSLAIFRQKLLFMAITPKTDYNIHDYVQMLFFLIKLAMAKVIESWEATSKILSMSDKFPNCKFLALCYFIPEAKKADPQVFKKLLEEANKIEVTEDILKPYRARFEELCEDDFEILRQLTEIGVEKSKIEYTIIKDDVDTLIKYVDSPNVSVNQVIPESPFAPWRFVQWEPTLTEYAMYFGSLNCVKALIERNSKRSFLAQYAVAGGNREAINFCSQQKMSFKSCLRLCAYFRRMDLFNWMVEKTEKAALSKELNIAMCRAVEADDIRMFLECCKNGTNINFQDENGETPYFIAAKEGNEHLIEYIKSFNGLRRNTANVFGKTAADVVPRGLAKIL